MIKVKLPGMEAKSFSPPYRQVTPKSKVLTFISPWEKNFNNEVIFLTK